MRSFIHSFISGIFGTFSIICCLLGLGSTELVKGNFWKLCSTLLVTPPLIIDEESGFVTLVTPLLVCGWSLAPGSCCDSTPAHWVSLALNLLVSDLSGLLCGESASTSAGVSNASDSSLLEGRWMDMKLSVLT